MLSVYPYGTGSAYRASYAITSSVASSASFIGYVLSASKAETVLFPESGSRGKSICLLTKEQYEEMIVTGKMELCIFS
jgi:hypothetical protein